MVSFVSCEFRRVKDHHSLLHYSPFLKNTCVGEVVLDKWSPLIVGTLFRTLVLRETHISLSIYIYIYRERERERDVYIDVIYIYIRIYIYIYIYVYIYIYREREREREREIDVVQIYM